jgi:hypothetical protein
MQEPGRGLTGDSAFVDHRSIQTSAVILDAELEQYVKEADQKWRTKAYGFATNSMPSRMDATSKLARAWGFARAVCLGHEICPQIV